MTTPPDEEEEGTVFGELFAMGAMFAFGAMLKRAVDIKNQGHHPPKPTRVVIDPDADTDTDNDGSRMVIPADSGLAEILKRHSHRPGADVIDADEFEDPPETP